MDNVFKTVGIIAVILLAIYLFFQVGLPLVGILIAFLWGIAALLAGLLKIILFLALIAGAIYLIGLLVIYLKEQWA